MKSDSEWNIFSNSSNVIFLYDPVFPKLDKDVQSC